MEFIEVTQTGSNQFALTDVVTDFDDGAAYGGDAVPLIRGYSYSAGGAAHDVLLVLIEGSTNAEDRTVLENQTGVNDFTFMGCAPIFVDPGLTTSLRFQTTSKAATGRLRVWYEIGIA